MDEKEKLIEKIGRQALEYDRDYSDCSQSVLKALQDNLDIGDDNLFKSATVLSGGIARRGEYCGVLIGALMAYSLAEGRERIEDFEVYSKACGVANEICEGFKKKVGSTICSEIQERMYGRSFDLRKEDDYQAFLDAGLLKDAGMTVRIHKAGYHRFPFDIYNLSVFRYIQAPDSLLSRNPR